MAGFLKTSVLSYTLIWLLHRMILVKCQQRSTLPWLPQMGISYISLIFTYVVVFQLSPWSLGQCLPERLLILMTTTLYNYFLLPDSHCACRPVPTWPALPSSASTVCQRSLWRWLREGLCQHKTERYFCTSHCYSFYFYFILLIDTPPHFSSVSGRIRRLVLLVGCTLFLS